MHHITQAEKKITRRQRRAAWWRVNWPVLAIVVLAVLACAIVMCRAADSSQAVPGKGTISLEGLAVTGEGRAQSH